MARFGPTSNHSSPSKWSFAKSWYWILHFSKLPSKRDVSRLSSTLHQSFSRSISASNYSIASAALIQLPFPASCRTRNLSAQPYPLRARCPANLFFSQLLVWRRLTKLLTLQLQANELHYQPESSPRSSSPTSEPFFHG
jgi:hypothetical protein